MFGYQGIPPTFSFTVLRCSATFMTHNFVSIHQEIRLSKDARYLGIRVSNDPVIRVSGYSPNFFPFWPLAHLVGPSSHWLAVFCNFVSVCQEIRLSRDARHPGILVSWYPNIWVSGYPTNYFPYWPLAHLRGPSCHCSFLQSLLSCGVLQPFKCCNLIHSTVDTWFVLQQLLSCIFELKIVSRLS